MKLNVSIIWILGLMSMTLIAPIAYGLPSGECRWKDPSFKDVIKEVNGDLKFGTIYVPRNAKIGSIIGPLNQVASFNMGNIIYLECSYKAGISTQVSGSVISNVAVAGSYMPKTGTLFSTNIQGVGVVFSVHNLAATGLAVDGNFPFLPFFIRINTWAATSFTPYIQIQALLVKTGEISMGSSNVTSKMSLVTDGMGVTQTVNLTANVVNAECQVPASSKLINVPMGTSRPGDFKGQGSTTAAKDFSIPLTSCATAKDYPSVPGNYFTSAFAYLKLDGVKGTTILDAAKGVIGLTSSSGAKGVGIQILKGDNTPLDLTFATAIEKLSTGDMQLPFRARYYQTGPTPPEPGLANASVNFTLTYK